jgi:hypothetical protein
MSELIQLDRREMLKAATGLLTGAVVAGSPLAALAEGRGWAIDLTTLTSAEGKALMAMARTIAPHDKLDDAAYAMVVKAMDEDASKSGDIRKMMREGVAQLGSEFAGSPEADRVTTLKKIEASPFFQAMRVKTLQVLYATPMAYAHFGYEGEAFSKGGYLFRGFNNLRWLPEVPAEDAGPING